MDWVTVGGGVTAPTDVRVLIPGSWDCVTLPNKRNCYRPQTGGLDRRVILGS